MKNYRRKIILCDVDGTLTKDICWTEKECLKARPNLSVIKKINKMAEDGYLIIWTARRDHLLPATLEWCRRNGVHFQAISNNKSACDIYVDDNCINVKNL